MLMRASRNGPLIPYNECFLHNRVKSFFKVHETSISIVTSQFTIKYNVVERKNVVLTCSMWPKAILKI